MIQSIVYAKNRGIGGIRVDALNRKNTKLGIIMGGNTRRCFVNNKPVSPSHSHNIYYNDFVELFRLALQYK